MEDKQKQIEEMAEDIERARLKARGVNGSMNQGFGMWYAKALWEMGYRKDESKCPFAYYLADRLLANGGVLPPCKVGDIVYMVTPGGKIHEKKVLGSKSVVGSNLRDEIWIKHSFTCESALVFNEDDIGKTVFLTREEAEQALKGEHNAEIH